MELGSLNITLSPTWTIKQTSLSYTHATNFSVLAASFSHMHGAIFTHAWSCLSTCFGLRSLSIILSLTRNITKTIIAYIYRDCLSACWPMCMYACIYTHMHKHTRTLPWKKTPRYTEHRWSISTCFMIRKNQLGFFFLRCFFFATSWCDRRWFAD